MSERWTKSKWESKYKALLKKYQEELVKSHLFERMYNDLRDDNMGISNKVPDKT